MCKGKIVGVKQQAGCQVMLGHCQSAYIDFMFNQLFTECSLKFFLQVLNATVTISKHSGEKLFLYGTTTAANREKAADS